MTEMKWLACTKPQAMLRFLKGKVSERKLRLFAVALHREYHHREPKFSGPKSNLAADTAEAFAEEGRSVDSISRLRLGGYFVLNPTGYGAATRLANIGDVPDAFKCSKLRCIFGPLPFRSVSIKTAWLTWHDGTIPKLAQVIYDDRAYDRLPILADAIEEAGCTDAELLGHLRAKEDHAKGCWALDAILGKD